MFTAQVFQFHKGTIKTLSIIVQEFSELVISIP